MQLKSTVARNNVPLFSNVYSVSQEGDLERAVSDALAEARKASGSSIFDCQIAVERP